MFTGLIGELGSVRSLAGDDSGYKLEIAAKTILNDLKLGDSVAVNGACLTVVHITTKSFTADVMPETLRHTNLGKLHIGEKVNLERTLRLCDGLEGHLVSGHVEGTGRILHRQDEGNAILFRIGCNDDLTRYIVKKGSVAVDGISLTVVEAEKNNFTVSIIPHTAAVTTLGFKQVGNWVNIETDMIGRYIEKFIGKDDKFWEHFNTAQ
ncbi:MAG: riboflavin synthase [Phascolarctobacterium sp.]|nr:riboflavin synthase [Candidatus Phascolarctobacterium caballi]